MFFLTVLFEKYVDMFLTFIFDTFFKDLWFYCGNLINGIICFFIRYFLIKFKYQGRANEDICSDLTNVNSSHWAKNPEVCDNVIDNYIQGNVALVIFSYLVGVAFILFVWLPFQILTQRILPTHHHSSSSEPQTIIVEKHIAPTPKKAPKTKEEQAVINEKAKTKNQIQ